MTQTVSKRDPQQQLSQNSARGSHEVHEKHASANASAGLNLNLFGALSGAFSSKQKRSTRVEDDGSIVNEEERHDKGEASALARAQGSARAAANAEQRELKSKQRVDHLGIEG